LIYIIDRIVWGDFQNLLYNFDDRVKKGVLICRSATENFISKSYKFMIRIKKLQYYRD